MKDAFESIIENAMPPTEVRTEHLLRRTVKVGEKVLILQYRRNDRVRAVMKQHKEKNPDKPIIKIMFSSKEDL